LQAAKRTAAAAIQASERAAERADAALSSRASSRAASRRAMRSKGQPVDRLPVGGSDDLFETTDSRVASSLLNLAPLPPPTSGRMPSLRGERISRDCLGSRPVAEDVQDGAVKPKGKWASISLGSLVDAAGVAGCEAPKLRSISELVDAASKSHQETKRSWRSTRETRTRASVAWAFNAFIYVGAALLSLTYGVKFRSNSTNEMITVWMLAMLQVYLVVEPLQILLVVCLPTLCTSQTRCGRGCTKTWKALNEIFRP